MRTWVLALAALAIPGAALAGSYRVVLTPPAGGKLLIGHGGVQAADDRTGTSLVRLVAPGNEVRERGTVRVLVMNLGNQPFEFGPDQVTLRLADGTELHPVPVDKMESGRILVEHESRLAAATDFRVRMNLDGLAKQSAMGTVPQSIGPASPTAPAGGPAQGLDRRTEELQLPGGQTLDAIYQILIPLTVPPAAAWGGYYVFDVPKPVQARRSDQPLTILVRTGAEEHRFDAMLKWR
ncbi:MAG: hypothetical protein V4513_03210 [Pseudomonadota bacterium]